MPRKHLSRLVLITATLVAAATGVTVAGVTSSGATTASAPTLPRLDAPGLHPQAAPDATATAPANSCGYQAAIPADRFKGIPVFNATQAAQPYSVEFVTTQGVITVKMLALTRRGMPGWVLPVLGGLAFALLVLIWFTSAFWFFSVFGFRR